jgi:hypothetical protein
VWSRAGLAVLHLLWFATSCATFLLAAFVPSSPLELEIAGLGRLESLSDTRSLALILAGLSAGLVALWLLVSALVRPLGVRLVLLGLLWLGWVPLLDGLLRFDAQEALVVRVRVGQPGEHWWQVESILMCP